MGSGRSKHQGAIEVRRGPQLAGVELHAGAEVKDSFHPHFHDEAQITHVLRGGREQGVRRKRVLLGPGDTVVIPSGAVHTGTSLGDRGWSFIAVYVAPAALAKTTDELELGQVCPGSLGFRHLSEPRMGELVLDLAGAICETSLAAETAWLSLILQIVRGTGAVAKVYRQRSIVRRARDFLEAHVSDPVTLDLLAKVTGVSKEHLVRSFTADLGLPPHAYQINARVERAKPMLLRGLSISDVAHSLGFHDQSHFARNFRKIVGIPPGRFVRVRPCGRS